VFYQCIKAYRMKKVRLFKLILLMLLCSNAVFEQTSQTVTSHPSQVDLMKKWIGYWRTEGTYITSEIRAYGIDGLEGYQKVQIKDSVAEEHRFIYGYNKKLDKYISASISKNNSGLFLVAFWFTSENVCKRIPFEDLSDPDRAASSAIYEFKSKDQIIATFREKNKPDRSFKIIREKK
jgi:hypothetical protein